MKYALPTRRAALLAISMLGAAATAQRLTPKDRSKEPLTLSLEHLVPQSFGEWKIDSNHKPVALATEADDAVYGVYDAVLARSYMNSKGQLVMLSVGYSRQPGGVQKPHWQENCYRTQGYKVSELTRSAQPVAGRNIPITRMLAVNGSRSEPVTYWLTLGPTVVADRWDRLFRLLAMGVTGEPADGFLVRISNISRDAQASYALHMAFAQDMLGAIAVGERRLLVGAG